AQMRVTIRGDGAEEYPVVKKIVDILQKQKINKFSLITSAE
ncbi:MAG: biopolymer transporter ExbD, partial [Pedobacter sp.]